MSNVPSSGIDESKAGRRPTKRRSAERKTGLSKDDDIAADCHDWGSRKLKPLGEPFREASRPSDDPALHHGRVRASPHIQGQWSTHVYIEVHVNAELRQALETAIQAFREQMQVLTSDILPLIGSVEEASSLHLSLSRPLQLWTNERADFRQAVRTALQNQASLASFMHLDNDDNSRSFLCCEIGHGFASLQTITERIDDVLKEKRLPPYYAEPRFHVSIAWWIPKSTTSTPTEPPSASHHKSSGEGPDSSITEMPTQALGIINEQYGKLIRGFIMPVRQITVKIGQDIHVNELRP